MAAPVRSPVPSTLNNTPLAGNTAAGGSGVNGTAGGAGGAGGSALGGGLYSSGSSSLSLLTVKSL